MRLAGLLLALLLVGCRSSGERAPWAEVERPTLTIERLDVTSGEAERFTVPAPALARILDVLRRAVPMRTDVAPAVQPVRYVLQLTAPDHGWTLELASRDVIGADGRYFRVPKLRAELDAAHLAGGGPDLLQRTGARLQSFLTRACARAEASERALLWLVAGAEGGRLKAGRGEVRVVGGRWLLVDPGDGSELDAVALPEGVELHPAYGARRLRIEGEGSAPADDRDRGPDALSDPDPERRQPFPAHFDLVLVEVATGRKLFVDLDPATRRLGLRIH